MTNPAIQIAMESPTRYKEAMDMGYQLCTRYSVYSTAITISVSNQQHRYPQLYNEGDNFYVWANNYTRVLQTTENFVRGFIGPNATVLRKIISVTSKSFASAVGNSLAPSDMCPAFEDGNGGDYQKTWDSIWQPRAQKRPQSMIEGNLTLTLSDIQLDAVPVRLRKSDYGPTVSVL